LSGAKSDAGDAAVIAEYLRLRAHRLQPATPYTAQTKALRTVVRAREDVVDMRVAAAQPSSPPCWTRTGPGAKAIFADVGIGDRVGVPDPLRDLPVRPGIWARNVCGPSVSSTATLVAGAPRNC